MNMIILNNDILKIPYEIFLANIDRKIIYVTFKQMF